MGNSVAIDESIREFYGTLSLLQIKALLFRHASAIQFHQPLHIDEYNEVVKSLFSKKALYDQSSKYGEFVSPLELFSCLYLLSSNLQPFEDKLDALICLFQFQPIPVPTSPQFLLFLPNKEVSADELRLLFQVVCVGLSKLSKRTGSKNGNDIDDQQLVPSEERLWGIVDQLLASSCDNRSVSVSVSWERMKHEILSCQAVHNYLNGCLDILYTAPVTAMIGSCLSKNTELDILNVFNTEHNVNKTRSPKDNNNTNTSVHHNRITRFTCVEKTNKLSKQLQRVLVANVLQLKIQQALQQLTKLSRQSSPIELDKKELEALRVCLEKTVDSNNKVNVAVVLYLARVLVTFNSVAHHVNVLGTYGSTGCSSNTRVTTSVNNRNNRASTIVSPSSNSTRSSEVFTNVINTGNPTSRASLLAVEAFSAGRKANNEGAGKPVMHSGGTFRGRNQRFTLQFPATYLVSLLRLSIGFPEQRNKYDTTTDYGEGVNSWENFGAADGTDNEVYSNSNDYSFDATEKYSIISKERELIMTFFRRDHIDAITASTATSSSSANGATPPCSSASSPSVPSSTTTTAPLSASMIAMVNGMKLVAISRLFWIRFKTTLASIRLHIPDLHTQAQDEEGMVTEEELKILIREKLSQSLLSQKINDNDDYSDDTLTPELTVLFEEQVKYLVRWYYLLCGGILAEQIAASTVLVSQEGQQQQSTATTATATTTETSTDSYSNASRSQQPASSTSLLEGITWKAMLHHNSQLDEKLSELCNYYKQLCGLS